MNSENKMTTVSHYYGVFFVGCADGKDMYGVGRVEKGTTRIVSSWFADSQVAFERAEELAKQDGVPCYG